MGIGTAAAEKKRIESTVQEKKETGMTARSLALEKERQEERHQALRDNDSRKREGSTEERRASGKMDLQRHEVIRKKLKLKPNPQRTSNEVTCPTVISIPISGEGREEG